MPPKEILTNDDWHGSVVYQIYPRSFYDSNGDGIGDLPGIIQKLDYLAGADDSLGVDAIWLSPFYPSPMADFGYDVSDYRDVDPIFGKLDDFKDLVEQSSKRGIKIIVDLVPNHTSDEHAWFKQSRQSPDNPYSDWYIWRDGYWPDPQNPDRMLPPNNWRSALTGQSAWQWDETRRQFYLHSFDQKQPDLNWSNPAVRDAIKDVMHFWLDLGVDGFRVDAVDWMAKEPLLSDDDPNPDFDPDNDLPYHSLLHNNSKGWPIVYAYLSEMAEVLKEEKYADKQRFMITETHPPKDMALASYMAYYIGMDPDVAAPFNFAGIRMPWEAQRWRHFLQAFHKALEQFNPNCVASYAFGNHDEPRLVSRLGEVAARASAVMMMSLPGMVFVYNGEEIGMRNVPIPKDKVQDPAALGDPVHGIGRDPERTPMQWDGSRNAGFSAGEQTWLPVADDYDTCNVEIELKDDASFLRLYQKLIKTRRASETLKYGDLEIIDTSHPDVLGYIRQNSTTKERFVTLVNFTDREARCKVDEAKLREVVVSSSPDSKISPAATELELLPFEAVLLRAERGI